ncbi:hypothetical protein Ciccas_010105, partial [Cichlidogyrus casuarinus]
EERTTRNRRRSFHLPKISFNKPGKFSNLREYGDKPQKRAPAASFSQEVPNKRPHLTVLNSKSFFSANVIPYRNDSTLGSFLNGDILPTMILPSKRLGIAGHPFQFYLGEFVGHMDEAKVEQLIQNGEQLLIILIQTFERDYWRGYQINRFASQGSGPSVSTTIT